MRFFWPVFTHILYRIRRADFRKSITDHYFQSYNFIICTYVRTSSFWSKNIPMFTSQSSRSAQQSCSLKAESRPCGSPTVCLTLLWKAFFFVSHFCVHYQTLRYTKANWMKIVGRGASGGGTPSLLSLHGISIYIQLSFVNFKHTIGQMWDWMRCYWQILLWHSTIHLHKTLVGFLYVFIWHIFSVPSAERLPCLKHFCFV